MAWIHHVGAAAKAKPLAILVADDTPELQALITGWLADAGHKVLGAASGREIVELVPQHDFDLIVTDILMPDGDGWDAIAEVRRLQPEIRVLAISGGAREMPANAVLRAARAAGALGLLAKPFTRPEFLAAVARVMSNKAEASRPARLSLAGIMRPGHTA
jgi:CheY-like chemotaxis protein